MTISGEGRMLGRYQLLFMLGQGGMGEVHLARLTGAAGFEKLCIVKTVLPNLMGDQSFIDRFHHEAKVLVQLTHSNIAQVYDMGDVDNTLYMAIEYVPGVDLSRVETRVERARAVMPVPMAVYIGQQITEALGYAHRKVGADGMPLGIVHRDVSPQNVMVSYEGEVKVIDFGLAKSTARSKHTLPSTVMGKLGYMSPEQALAKPVDHRSDIFSAGIVVWEMLAGRSMYAGGTMSEMVAQMAVAEVPSLSAARPDISPILEQIVMRALAKDPAARYQRADDFARALNELAVREQMTVGAEDVGNYVRAMCPEEFAAERQLQSKLSVMRKGGPVAEVMPEPEMEGTFMRPSSGSGGVAAQTASGSVMTPAQRAMSMVAPAAAPARAPVKSVAPTPAPTEAPIVVPKSRAPLLVVGLLALLGLAGGGAYLVQQRDQPVAPPADPVVVPPVAAVEPPPKEPTPAVAEPTPTPAPEALEYVTVEGKTWKVLRKNGEDFVILGKGDLLKEGDRLNIVGEVNEAGKSPVYAHAAVLKLKGSVASLIFDESGALPDVVYAAKDAAPRRPVVARKDPVKTTEPAKTAEPTKPAEPTEPEKAPEPVKTADPEPMKVEAFPKSNVTQLFGTVRMSAANILGARTVLLQSQNAFSLTNCELRLPSNMVYRFGKKTIFGNETAKVPFREFRPDSRAPDPQFKQDWAALYCREGTGYLKTTYDRR